MGVIVLNDVPCNFSLEIRLWLSDGSLHHRAMTADLKPVAMSARDLEAITLRAMLAGYKPFSHMTKRKWTTKDGQTRLQKRTSVTGAGS